MEPWREELYSWLNSVGNEPGHNYLYDPFQRLVALFIEDEKSLFEVEEFFTRITACLAREVNFALHSFERAIPFIETSPAQTKLSDLYGESVRKHGRLGGYVVVDEHIDPHPSCACGGPHYEFSLRLGAPWSKYVTRCYSMLVLKATELRQAGMRSPCLEPKVAEVLLQPFRPFAELHVGRGAFRAYLRHGLSQVQLAKALSMVGMHVPASEERHS